MDTSTFAELDKGKRPMFLGIVDQLRELGIGEDLSLPQLVVVGNQSSGKSSLLEGLTGLFFPVASDLCTRFATQIILRRVSASEAKAQISILPGPTRINDEIAKAQLAKFTRTMEKAVFTSDQLGTILDEASVCMGLPKPGADMEVVEKRFSDDIVKIELSGPGYPHLSVVDVPGLFHNPTIYQTKEDLEVIRQLINDYISEQRTIILAVMDACNNLANQEVFNMARAVDPNGDRTLGIITKCDVVQSGGEKAVIQIAQNNVTKLKHGWFAVRNRSPKEIEEGISLEERNARENAFFNKKPWSDLKKTQVGISALSTSLAILISEHIQKEFPKLRTEIDGRCLVLRTEIGKLGSQRQSTLEQRQYLIQIAARYQQKAVECLTGAYEDFADPEDPIKLRMHVRNHSDSFGQKMVKEGHLLAFANTDDTEDEAYHLEHETDDDEVSRSQDEDTLKVYTWIEAAYRQSRGCELPGTVNPAVIQSLFRQQTGKWESVARNYIDNIKSSVDAFLDTVLVKVSADSDVRHRLLNKLGPMLDDAHTQAHQTLDEILEDERGGVLQTVNDDYGNNLDLARGERVLARLHRLGLEDGRSYIANMKNLKNAAHLSNMKQARNDIHDVLKAYYQIAIKRFMDSVVNNAVERFFFGANGCIKAFNAEFVGRLSDEELFEIAGESLGTTNTRKDLEEKLQRFEKASKITRVH